MDLHWMFIGILLDVDRIFNEVAYVRFSWDVPVMFIGCSSDVHQKFVVVGISLNCHWVSIGISADLH